MRRSWLIGIVAGAVVLVLLWYVALFSPTSSDLDSTKSKTAEAQRNQQELKNDIARLKELSANAPQQQADLRALQAAIPENPDLGAFILQANEIASSSGIQWLSISPTPPAASTSGAANSTIAVSMQIQGGFFQLLDYLNRLEDLDRLVIVDSISVTAGGDSSGSGASGSSGSSSSSSFDTGSSSGTSDGAPSLSVTLTGRMFTQAAPAAGSTGGTATAGGGTTTGTFPSSNNSSSSSSSSSNSSTGNS